MIRTCNKHLSLPAITAALLAALLAGCGGGSDDGGSAASTTSSVSAGTGIGLPAGEHKAPLMGRSNEGKPGTRKTRYGKVQRKFGGRGRK